MTAIDLRKDSTGLARSGAARPDDQAGQSRKAAHAGEPWGPSSGLTWDRNGRELVISIISSNRKPPGWSLWRIPLEGEPVMVSTRLAGRPDEPVMSARGLPTGEPWP